MTPARRQVLVLFVALAALTAVEIALSYAPAPRALVRVGLVAFAFAKAALVVLFFMHLKDERRALKLMVAAPLVFPALYAAALIAEALGRSAP